MRREEGCLPCQRLRKPPASKTRVSEGRVLSVANHGFMSKWASVIEHRGVTPIRGMYPKGLRFGPVNFRERIMRPEESKIKEAILFPIVPGPACEAEHRFSLPISSVKVFPGSHGTPP